MRAMCAPARKTAVGAPSFFAANASKSALRLNGSLAIACSRLGDTDRSLPAYSQRKNLRRELRLRDEEPGLETAAAGAPAPPRLLILLPSLPRVRVALALGLPGLRSLPRLEVRLEVLHHLHELADVLAACSGQRPGRSPARGRSRRHGHLHLRRWLRLPRTRRNLPGLRRPQLRRRDGPPRRGGPAPVRRRQQAVVHLLHRGGCLQEQSAHRLRIRRPTSPPRRRLADPMDLARADAVRGSPATAGANDPAPTSDR